MAKRMKSVTCAVLVALASMQAAGMPLEEDLKSVLSGHPLLKANRHAIEAAHSRVDAATAGHAPRLSVSGDAGLEGIRSESYKPNGAMQLGKSGTVTPATESELNRRKVSVSVEQNLYNGGRTNALVGMAGSDESLQQVNLRAQVQDVLLEAITAYLQVGRFQTLIGLTRLNEDTTRQQLDLENKRVQGGGGIAVDVMQARTRLQIVKERRVFYEQSLRDALANYEQAFGHAPDLSRFQEVGIHSAGLPATLNAALDEGTEQSARLKAAQLQVVKAREQIRLEQAGRMPSVDLVLSRNMERGANAVAARDDYAATVRMSWNFSMGLENQHRVAAAVKDRDELTEREVATRNKVRENIRISWNQVVNGQERLELLDSAANIARDVMNDRKRLRDAGKETALSALDAEVEYFGVLANKINAMYDARIGSYRLMAAVGRLSPETIGLTEGGFMLPVKPLVVDLQSIAGPAAR